MGDEYTIQVKRKGVISKMEVPDWKCYGTKQVQRAEATAVVVGKADWRNIIFVDQWLKFVGKLKDKVEGVVIWKSFLRSIVSRKLLRSVYNIGMCRNSSVETVQCVKEWVPWNISLNGKGTIV